MAEDIPHITIFAYVPHFNSCSLGALAGINVIDTVQANVKTAVFIM